jgi:hypothetical protein
VRVSSVDGSYQFYSEKQAPLELVYLTNNFAVLVPGRNILAKPPPNSFVYPGFMTSASIGWTFGMGQMGAVIRAVLMWIIFGITSQSYMVFGS